MTTHPEIAYAVHQCACFCVSPKHSHREAVKHIGCYLLSTKDQGIILKPKQDTFDCWVDTSHAGEWKKQTAVDDVDTTRSRTGYVIMFAGCPLIWASKLRTEITLSSTEAEYVALSTATREIIHLIDFLKEAKEMVSQLTSRMQQSTVRFLRITLAPLIWLKYLRCALAQNILILSIIIFINMCYQYMQLAQRIKLQTSSQNPLMELLLNFINFKLVDGECNISKQGSVGFIPFFIILCIYGFPTYNL